jgi:hypothetical protein
MTGAAVLEPDRRLLLFSPGARFNGVDFAEVRPGRHARIDVHFINRVRIGGTLARDRVPVTLTGGSHPRDLFVYPIHEDSAWSTDTGGRPVLHVTAEVPGPGSRYILTVHSERIDPCFQSAGITFPGPDDADIDCAGLSPTGPAQGGPTVPIDYLAKDFASFCQALSKFSAARYPRWVERSEADLGVMLMEALSALADELSYLQDRVAAEATLDTATQLVSLVRHARLIDYEPAPALAATTLMQFDVAKPMSGVIQCEGTNIQGETVEFAAGAGIPGLTAGTASALGGTAAGPSLDPRWNRYDETGVNPQLVPYLWDPDTRCLRQGALSMWISGHDHGFSPGQELLIDTSGVVSGDSPVREVVVLTEVSERTDPVRNQPVTLIRWANGLASEHNLTRTQVAGNLLPARQGRIAAEVFMIPSDGAAPGGLVTPAVLLASVRSDHMGAAAHCVYSVTGSVAWLSAPAPDGGPVQARPALELHALAPALGGTAPPGDPARWQWVRRLLDADATARSFTVTAERYSPARVAADPPFYDYDGDGTTIRFGDGTFGRPPVPGTTFQASYLAGGGADGNVGADTILSVTPGDPAGALVRRCSNPFPATGGVDAETVAQIRDRAPQQIKAGLLSLTDTADYQAAALSYSPRAASSASAAGLAWARQAVTAFRWTGSWRSALTIVDPRSDEPTGTQISSLAGVARLLDTKRLAGAESSVALARYRRLDLRITCRAQPTHRRGDVEAAVLARLDPRPSADGTTGFFGRDRWTFGQALEALPLTAAVQSCAGVAGVEPIQYRAKPGPAGWRVLPPILGIASGEILRIDNDRDRPQRGLLFVVVEVAP